MPIRFVYYRDVRMCEEWPEKIREAQQLETYVIHGRELPRIRYGKEGWRGVKVDALIPCHDCAVFKGEYHVPGCDMERCPACGGQAISCGCAEEDDQS